jgi:ubiquinone/menaquinone biosynthesis C-methylase UbiE
MSILTMQNDDPELPTSENWKKAQQSEQLFWQEVRRSGYAELSWEQLFNEHQRYTMLSLISRIKPLDAFRDDTVIDLGCGPMGLPCYLECRQAIGVDPLMAVYAQSYEHLRQSPPHVRWIASRGEEVPLADGMADVVFSRNALDHVESPYAWMREFVRLLRPGGAFMLYVDLSAGWEKNEVDMILHPQNFTEESLNALMQGFPLTFDYIVDREGAAKYNVAAPMIITGTRVA